MPKDKKRVPPWRERQRSLERAPSHPSRPFSSRLGAWGQSLLPPHGALASLEGRRCARDRGCARHPKPWPAAPPGAPETPLHADPDPAALGPLQPHIQVRPWPWSGGRCCLAATPDHDSHPRVLSFPRNLLSPSETRRGLAAAFRMWSDVSPFSFREVAPEQPSDLRIGFYPVNHTDCLVSPTHHCFDGPTGELAHAFFPPHGGIHFDDSEYWVLGPTRYSWKKGDAGLASPEFPFPTVAATAPPPRTKTRLVPEGRNVTFRCGQKILHKKGKVYWYKDQEPLEFSYPGYLALGDAHLSIIANAINEGTYTCVVRRRQHVLSTYSWRVRLRS
eukprot:bmy_10043T0